MPADYTATGLIAAVRRNAALGPENGDAFPTNSDILAWVNEETTNYIVAVLMRPREERFVENYDFETVAQQIEYSIPTASLWEDVRDVQTRWTGAQEWVSLPRIEPENVVAVGNPATASYPTGYYLRANEVCLVPTPGAAIEMRIRYFRRPGYVVSTGYSAMSDVAGSSSPYTVTVASTTSLSAGDFDLVSSAPPFNVIVSGAAGTIASPTTVSLAMTSTEATLAAAQEGASYLIAHGDTPGPQFTQDLYPLLLLRTTYRALLAKKDKDGMAAILKECDRTEAKIVASMNQRADGLGRHVVDRKFSTPFYRLGVAR